MCLKVPEDVHKKAPSSGTPQNKWTSSTLQVQRSWKEWFSESQGRNSWMTPDVPKFPVLPCPLQQLQTMREDLPQSPRAAAAVSPSASAPASTAALLDREEPWRAEVSPKHPLTAKVSPQTNQREQRAVTQKHQERNTALEQEKKPQEKQKRIQRSEPRTVHHNILGVVACRGVVGQNHPFLENAMIGLYPKWILLIAYTSSNRCHHHFLLLLFGFQFFLLWWQLLLTLHKEYSYSWLFLIYALNPPLPNTGLVIRVFSKEQWHLKRTPTEDSVGILAF